MKTKEQKTFQVGDTVTWFSSGTSHTGKVVSVVERGQFPEPALKLRGSGMRFYFRYGGGDRRDHESYLVAVKTGKTDAAKLALYWPRVSALSKVQGL